MDGAYYEAGQPVILTREPVAADPAARGRVMTINGRYEVFDTWSGGGSGGCVTSDAWRDWPAPATRFDLGELIDALDEFGEAKTAPVSNKPTPRQVKESPFELSSLNEWRKRYAKFSSKPWDAK